MSISNKKQNRINQWMVHKTDASERSLYSIKRMDILMISICGACIYIAFEILKFLNTKEGIAIEYNDCLLKVSALFAVLAIIINFASQMTGNKSNEEEIKLATHKIDTLLDKDKTENNHLITNEIINSADKYGNTTNWLNKIAFVLMAISIFLLVVFNLITF